MRKSLEDFRFEVEMYGSLEVVERYLAKDWQAMLRENFERLARKRAIDAFMRKRMEVEAVKANRSIDQIADDYAQTVARNAHIRIIDENFKMPDGRKVFPSGRTAGNGW